MTTADSMLPVDRWVFTGKILVTAPMAIHTGHEEVGGAPGTTIQPIERDCQNNPFIPGSAIKGLLRHLAASHEGAPLALIEKLLGGMAKDRGSATGAKLAQGGSAEIRNAWLCDDGAYCPIRGQTALDRASRTAADGMLRQGPAVAPGTGFMLEIVADRARVDEAELLLGLLQLAQRCDQPIGSGGGRIRIENIQVSHLAANEILAWLQQNNKEDWQDFAVPAPDLRPLPLSPRGQACHFPIALQIGGYFLVGVDQGEKPSDKINVKPYSSRHGQVRPELPASSFDGAFRSQAERIWRTVHGFNVEEDWVRTPPPPPLAELFGSRDTKGLFIPDDFLGSEDTPLVTVHATAIDRISSSVNFTGPVTTQAFEAPLLKGGFTLCFRHEIDWAATGQPQDGAATTREISPAAIGLLALILRDLAEGDVSFGRGTRNGYGDVLELTSERGGLHDLLKDIALAWKPDTAAPQDVIEQAVHAFREWPTQKPASPSTVTEAPV